MTETTAMSDSDEIKFQDQPRLKWKFKAKATTQSQNNDKESKLRLKSQVQLDLTVPAWCSKFSKTLWFQHTFQIWREPAEAEWTKQEITVLTDFPASINVSTNTLEQI